MLDTQMMAFLNEQIAKIPGKKKVGRKYINVICPWHDDHSPSLGIRIANPTHLTPLGSVKCIACGQRGDWNSLADRLGLKRLASDTVVASEAWVDLSQYDDLVTVSALTEERILQQQFVDVHAPWPVEDRWRGFSGHFLRRFAARSVIRYNKDRSVASRWLWFPVHVDHAVVGGFLARLNKREGAASYLNSPGEWIGAKGLWPYDYVCDLAPGYVVLVEGQRDALRLLRAGVPALCVFGSENFTRAKAGLVCSIPGVNTVYAFGDNDDAGRKFNQLVQSTLRNRIRTRVVTLPEKLEGDDPGSVPFSYIQRLKRAGESALS